MKDEVTVSLKPWHRKWICEIIASQPGVETPEQALLWSLGKAIASPRRDRPRPYSRRDRPRTPRVTELSPYDVPGLEPRIAPSPAKPKSLLRSRRGRRSKKRLVRK